MKDYKDLIAKLRGTKTQSKRKLLDDAADAIEHLQRQLAHKQDVLKQQAETIMDLRRERSMGEWISVKERLPGFRQYVLVVSDDGIYTAEEMLTWEDGPATIYIHDLGEYRPFSHWLPLPELPEEG